MGVCEDCPTSLGQFFASATVATLKEIWTGLELGDAERARRGGARVPLPPESDTGTMADLACAYSEMGLRADALEMAAGALVLGPSAGVQRRALRVMLAGIDGCALDVLRDHLKCRVP